MAMRGRDRIDKDWYVGAAQVGLIACSSLSDSCYIPSVGSHNCTKSEIASTELGPITSILGVPGFHLNTLLNDMCSAP